MKIYTYILISCGLIGGFSACKSEVKEKKEVKIIAADSMSIEKLLESINRQMVMSPNNYALYNERSEVYLKMDSLNKAIQDVEKSIVINDSVSESHYLRGFYACLAKDTTKAIDELAFALKLGTPNPEVSYQLGQIHLHRNNYTDAERMFEIATRLDTTGAIYTFAQGFLREKQKKISEAVTLYKKAIRQDSLFAKPYLQLHDLYMRHFDNPDEAFKYNDLLLKKQNMHPLAHYNRANADFNKAIRRKIVVNADGFKKDIQKSIDAYSIVLKADSNFVQAYYERGYAAFLIEKYDEAISDFEKCLQKNPDYYQASFMLGSIYEFYKDKTTALNYYKKSLTSKPDFKDAQRAVTELTK